MILYVQTVTPQFTSDLGQLDGNEGDDTYTLNVGSTGDQGNERTHCQGYCKRGTWQQVVGSMSGANRYMYVDGVPCNTDTTGVATIPTNTEGAATGT